MSRSICSSRATSMVVLVLGLAGCTEDEFQPARCSDFARTTQAPDIPVAYATEHLDIHVEDGQVLCAGSAREYENFYRYVSDQLGVSSSARVPVFVLKQVGGFCRDGSLGCRTQDGVVFATPGATHHELTHSASCEWRSGSAPSLAEGLAVSFEVTPLTDWSAPQEFVAAEKLRDVDYGGAGHFVRWLVEERGVTAFRALYEFAPRSGGDNIIDIFATVYQQDVDALFSDYAASAPFMWTPHRQCADLETLSPVIGSWKFDAIFDCDQPSTLGPYERAGKLTPSDFTASTSMYQSFLLEIDSPGAYRFEREADTGVWIERCIDEVALTEEQADQLWLKEGLFADLQGTTTIDLTPGTYRIDVRRPYAEPHPVWLRIEPDPGN